MNMLTVKEAKKPELNCPADILQGETVSASIPTAMGLDDLPPISEFEWNHGIDAVHLSIDSGIGLLKTLWHKPNWEAVWNPMCTPHWFAFRRTMIKGSSFVDVEQLPHFTTWQLCYFSNGGSPPQWPKKARNNGHSESLFLKIPGQMVIYNVKRNLIQH